MKVLIAEYDAAFIYLVAGQIRSWGYDVLEAADGSEAWRLIQNQMVDVVVCDWLIPHVSGLDLCRRIRQAGLGRYIYVIMISGCNAPEPLVEALESGADDYLRKPLDFKELRARLAIGRRVVGLQEELNGRIAALQRAHGQSIRMVVQLIEVLDPELGGHSRRTAELSLEMARRCKMADQITPKALTILEAAALLHDVGLLLLPKSVWTKRRNERSSDEQDLFQQHPASGARILGELEILKPVARLVGWHHEQHNGMGFPQGVDGRRLPLLAQIVAAAAVYDNLIHRGGYAPDEAVQQLHRMRHVQLAPAMVDLLLEIHHERRQRDETVDHQQLPLDRLCEGMVLSRDLTRINGAVLIPKGTPLTHYTIAKIKNYNRLRTIGDTVAVDRVP